MTARQLIEKLPIVSEDVLAEAAVQPQLFMEAAQYRIEKMRGRSQASAELEQNRSRIALKVRAEKDPTGKKPTEGAVMARVELSATTKQFRQNHDDACAKEEFSKLILEAYRMRRDAIRILADHMLYNRTTNEAELNHIEESRQLRSKARQLLKARAAVDEE
jgi:hypothetical protein